LRKDDDLAMGRQIGRLLLGVSVSLAVVGASSFPISAQPIPSQDLVRAIRESVDLVRVNRESVGRQYNYSQFTYMFGEIDLNGDGVKEAIVYTDSPFCGVHNCPYNIFQKRGHKYRSIDGAMIKIFNPQIAVLKSKTAAWSDIAVPAWPTSLKQEGWYIVQLGIPREQRSVKVVPSIQPKLTFNFRKMKKFNLADDGAPDAANSQAEIVPKTIQDLPDGDYFYGEHPDPSKSAKNYIVFRKVGNALTGIQYYTATESWGCFTGEVNRDKVINATKASLERIESERTGRFAPLEWKFSTNQTLDFHAVNTGKSNVRYNIGFDKTPSFGLKGFESCKSLLSNRLAVNQSPRSDPSNSSPLPAPAQFPTQAEFDRVKKIAAANRGTAMAASDLAQRKGFRGFWRNTNASVASFIGGWTSQKGQNIYVYPSSQQRRVCVVTQTDTQTHLDIGYALGTEVRYGGDKGLFIADPARPEMLAARDAKSSELSPIFAMPGSATTLSDSDLDAMQRAKCITQLPGGQIAQKPSAKKSSPSFADFPELKIINLGCTQNLKTAFGQSAPDYCRSAEADSGILFEEFNPTRNADNSISLDILAFNRGSADALIETYDANGKLQDIQIIDGNKPPSGLIQSGTDMFTRYPASWFSRYPFSDIRRDLKANKAKIKIPAGGSVNITKSSQYAQLYNATVLTLDVSQVGSDSGFTKVTTARQLILHFVKETAGKTSSNIFKSAPNAKAIFSLDFIDPQKMAKLLHQFVAYSLTAEGKPLTEDPLKSPLISALADVVVSDANESLEIALDRYVLPGLGKFAQIARTTGDGINTAAKAVDLSNSITIGEKGTITLRNQKGR
jgi:hypothetical protein